MDSDETHQFFYCGHLHVYYQELLANLLIIIIQSISCSANTQ